MYEVASNGPIVFLMRICQSIDQHELDGLQEYIAGELVRQRKDGQVCFGLHGTVWAGAQVLMAHTLVHSSRLLTGGLNKGQQVPEEEHEQKQEDQNLSARGVG